MVQGASAPPLLAGNLVPPAQKQASEAAPRRIGMTRAPPPPPQRVRYNDWRQLEIPAPEAFTPELPVSVILPYFAQPEELARMLAALEGQSYPRDLIEVVVVDDGSVEPLTHPHPTPLNVKVVRKEDRGHRPAAARNAGARAAAHDILVFLDSDLMPEAELVAAHARWHHAVPDALTLGMHAHVLVDDVDPGMIRSRSGTIEDLLEGKMTSLDVYQWLLRRLRSSDDLTVGEEVHFELVMSCNFGIRREFFDLVEGFDESFSQWGGEDTEFGYRAFIRGGLLVPVRDAFAWHQGSWKVERARKERSRENQVAKFAQLMAYPRWRSCVPDRTFTVPEYVVTIRGRRLPAERLLDAVRRVLSGSVHDLVIRLEDLRDDADKAWIEGKLGPDSRVWVAPSRTALEEFPASPFHITLPASVKMNGHVVRRLREGLGDAVLGRAELPDGTSGSIARAWALHRAQRSQWEASDFGDVVSMPGRAVFGGVRTRIREKWCEADGPGAALQFGGWLAGAVLRKVIRRFRPLLSEIRRSPPDAPPSGAPKTPDPLGVEIAALGARSQAVFRASEQVALGACAVETS